MNNFITLSVGEGISFKLPATWVEEAGDPGEYAFINGDGSIFLTATFMRIEKEAEFSLKKLMAEATDPIAKMADFASPLLQTDQSIARHIVMGNQNMLIAMIEEATYTQQVIANLFFKTEDADIFEKNRALMEEIIQAVEIKG